MGSLIQVVSREGHLRDRGSTDGPGPPKDQRTLDQGRIKWATDVKRLINEKKKRVWDI